jgi:probable F420-dependent oxidoreductase
MTDLRDRLSPLGVWGHLATLPAAELRPFAARASGLGYGCLWVAEASGREPFALLAALAEAAGPMWLGTSIVNVFGRDAMASRMGAMTLHELTGGRFVLGLGVSHPHLVEKLRGHVWERPLTRMREYLAEYRRLPYRGPTLPATAGAPEDPPTLIAALRRRMLELAAQESDGAFPYLVTAARVAWVREILDAAAPADRHRPYLAVTLPAVLDADVERGRAAARAYLPPYLRAPNYQASLVQQGFEPADWEPPYSDRIVDALVAIGDAPTLRARVREMQAAGADHVAVIPLGPEGTAEHLPVLEALAPARVG